MVVDTLYPADTKAPEIIFVDLSDYDFIKYQNYFTAVQRCFKFSLRCTETYDRSSFRLEGGVLR